MPITTDYEHKYEKGGLKLRAFIPPYVWKYQGGHVDIDIYDETGTNSRFCGLAITMANNTAEELNKLVEALPIEEVMCQTCKARMMKQTSEYRITDECEQCCLTRLDAEFEAEIAETREEEKKADIDAFTAGYRFRTDLWVYPSRGDDYMLTWHTVTKPTKSEVIAILKQRRSRKFDDFKIMEITEKGVIGETWI